MKNNKNLKIKILLSMIALIILSAITYISLPYISYALENAVDNFLENVGKISVPANGSEIKNQIHEHRGWTVIANYSATEAQTYEQAVGKTGISDINSYIKTYMSPSTGDCAIGAEPLLGWVGSLCYNTSIFCQESGIPFPGLKARVFNGFHAQQNTNRNEEKDIIQDFVEWCPPLACEKQITIYLEDYKEDGIELRESKMSEADIYYATGFKWVLGDFEVFTSTRVDYTASPRDFDTVESYIFTYSLRNYHRYNPAQVALWKYKNNKEDGYALEQGLKLYRAAKAVNELKNPTKPQMSVTTTSDSLAYSTGTVLDGNNYKVGPIKMNGYSYGWSEDVKDFSGQSSLDNPQNATILANKTAEQKEFFKGLIAGIVEAKLKLDNGKEIILDKDNFKVEGGSTNSGSSFYSYPTMAQGYEYPTPNSNFYIILPISECVGATKIEKVTMTYKWHTADGNGGDLDGYYYELKWTSSGTMSLNEATTYHCDNSYGGYACVHDSLSPDERSCYYGYGWDDYNVNQNAHDFWCGTKGYCFDGRNVSHRHCNGYCRDCYGHQGGVSCGMYEHTHGSGCNTSDCYHTHSSLCCSKTSHTHSAGCYDSETGAKTCTLSAHTHGSGCNKSDCYHTHSSLCCSKYEHTHDDWYSRYNTGCYSTKYCAYATLDYCVHGHQNGKHVPGECESWGTTHIDNCYGPEGEGTRCNAHPDADGGGHRNCATFDWKCAKKTPVDVQKLMYVTDAQVYEHNLECYIENIPLVAKVEIDKYIHDVEHAKTVTGVADDSFGPSDDRRELEETDKQGNPVYVESDDYVTYKIILKNSSAFGVKVKVDDVLPSNTSAYKFVSANVGGTTLTNINDLRNQIITISAGSDASPAEASLTVTLQVKALEGIYENKARIITRNGTPKNTTDDIDYIRTVDDDGPVVNHISTTCNGTTQAPEWESSDWFILNNYNTFIDKYIYKYDEAKQNENNDTLFITNEESIVDANDILKETRMSTSTSTKKVSDGNLEDTVRVVNKVTDKYGNLIGEHELYKANHPVNVEKYEKVTYAIRVYNDATKVENTLDSGDKTPTKFKVSTIEDKLHNGLQYSSIKATIFRQDGSKRVPNVLGVGCSLAGASGEYNIYNITTSTDTVLEPGEYIEFYMEVNVIQSNMYLYEMKNEAKIKKISNINDIDVTTRNISEQDTTTEYIRMKDLVISGRVWVDFNKNGLMDDYASSDFDKINNNINDDAMKEDVVVRLYRVGDPNNPIRTTKTDENGLYTFARNESLTWYPTYNNTIDYSEGTKYQRIDKASNKDAASGNYTSASEYYQYYVEFVYDGVVYKSTEIYADMSNLTGNGNYNEEYLIDSNAAEIESERESFNKNYEYISYDIAYDLNNNKATGGDLEFQKDGHASYLKENDAREMTAKSFIDAGTENIKYLWLYPFNSGVNRTTPETDYLKYINLGLELREDVDLSLSKDVYSVKTTINGEEMEYDYNLGNTLEYTNPYIVSKPYGFEVYEADYKYRIEQYISEAVETFKGNGADELNIEVTYRINLKNEVTPDQEGGSINTPLNVKVHEVLDLYDQNFMDATAPSVTAMVKDATGKLIPKQIETAEAWMFMTKAEASGRELLDGGKTYSIRLSEVEGGKPTYILDADGEYVKAKLSVSGSTANYSIKKDNNFTADGYKTAYITGMGDIIIPEGGSIDIYVKYLLDKAELEITVDEDYEQTQTSEIRKFDETTKTSSIEIVENEDMTEIISTVRTETKVLEGKETTVRVANLKRSIRLAEKINTTFKNMFGRGTENIAQINAYSVWYTDGEPASLVDKDSNAGNIGINNTSVDDVTYYEDMAYKTGIEIVADGTENTREEIELIYDERLEDEEIEIFRIPKEDDDPLTRRITGTVWDDSRSTTLGNEAANANTAQYIGNGMYNPGGDGKIDQAKSNDNVKLNYKEDHVTEDTDIAVRNAKAEFVEIINVDGRYYEETLTHITWDQKQSARTDENGEYELYGLVPGTYVVRFTYGDYIDIPDDLTSLSEEQKDMLIFNGQDYKSTQYTGADESLDPYIDADKIIVEFNDEHESDARDDEIRRLEVNNYSEVMTNEVAEILKGLANGTELTPNSSKNDKTELEALAKNTYMIADTREFLVKPEKLLDEHDGVPEDQIQKTAYKDEYMYSDSSPFYKHFTSMKNKHIEERNYDIRNVDFGIEYRPESEISLMKEIVQLTLITEDNETLVDLHFETKNVGNQITHEINKEKSIGYDLVQFITNDYKPKSLINNIVSEEYVQGLAYIQVDEEILQGCTVKITYGFNAQNCSEVDRISTNLNEIRYKYNEATQKLIDDYKAKYSGTKELAMVDLNNISNDSKYTATALAKAVVFADTYNVDDEGIVYREIPKTVTTNGDDGYYGRYVGYGYYTGELSNLDTISSLKFDKILDYIDTNLEYEQKSTSEEVIDRLWYKITSRELISLVSHYKGLRQTVESMSDEELPKVTDADGVEYKSMVVSVDDRNVDPGDPNEKDERANAIKNKDLSRFLVPKVTAVGLNGNDDIGKENDENGELGYDDYTGHIYLDVSKVLAAGSDDDDKTYENMAEIVQFTTLNGRRTNFATTIGNANIIDVKERLDKGLPPFDETEGKNSGSIEFITASIEPDTSATETITLIPPTGLMKNRRAIVSIMETAKAGVEVMSMTGLVVAIVAGIAFLVILAIRKYKKRRIK